MADILEQIDPIPEVGNLKVAMVYKIKEQEIVALRANGEQVQIPWQGLSWAARYINSRSIGAAPKSASDIVKNGDVIYIQERSPKQWALAQIPEPGAAIVSLDPHDGSILALSGGFDFFHTKFNRATQAKRQPGSSFKPFVYAAALEQGFTAASIINDAPVVFENSGLESSWRPENYSGEIYGPTRLREALTHSRNLVSIRLLQAVGVGYTIDFATKFGFDPSRLPRDLSLSLGTASVTPLELAAGYTVFANGGFRVTPHFISKIVDGNGKTIFEAHPLIACPECDMTDEAGGSRAPRVVSEQVTYITTSMMQDVIRYGTGRRALQLGRSDLAGKTGTTNDQRDAWFAGYNGDVVTVSWVGLDNAKSLGSDETGGKAALPMWISYMGKVLKDVPMAIYTPPEGVVAARINPATGLRDTAGGLVEYFLQENLPAETDSSTEGAAKPPEEVKDQLL